MTNLAKSQELEKIVHSLEKELVTKAKTDFRIYVHLMAPTLMPGDYKTGPHIDLMCAQLQKLFEETRRSIKNPKDVDAPRLMINIAPGAMKSIILCLFISWVYGQQPTWRIIHLGHSGQFAADNYGAQTRDIMKSPEYGQIFPGVTIREDTDAKGRWNTNRGGQYIAKGVGQKITGRRAHIAVVDDPLSAQDAESKIEREKKNKWYTPGLQTRLLAGASEVMVMHRWHMDDLAGNRLAKDNKAGAPRPWKVIKIPALCTEESAKLLGLNKGDSFWPDLWPTRLLEEKKNESGMAKSFWSAQYMQEPVPEEGNIIKIKDICDWPFEEPPTVDYIAVSVDTAFSTKDHADYSAYTVWGVFRQVVEDYQGNERQVPCIILLEADRGRWDFTELCRKIDALYAKHSVDNFLIENKASGQSLIQELRRRGFPVIEYNPDRDKISKAYACQGFFESKRVYIPLNLSWTIDIVNELTSFPSSPNDDYTDTTTQLILWLRDSWRLDADNYAYQVNDEDEADTGRHNKGRRTYWTQAKQRLT